MHLPSRCFVKYSTRPGSAIKKTVMQCDARLREIAIDCDYTGSFEDRLKKQQINIVKEDALKMRLLGSKEDSFADII